MSLSNPKKITKLLTVFAAFCIYFFSINVNAQVVDKAKLEAELKLLEQEIENQKQLIESKQKEGKTLERDITILDTKIKKSENEIKLRERSIKNISLSIQDKSTKIGDLNKKIDRQKESMENVFRSIELEKKTSNNLVLAVFSGDTISESFNALNSNEDLQGSLKSTLDNVKNTKRVLESVVQELEVDKEEEEGLKSQQITQKKEIEINKGDKKNILQVTKGEEKLYKNLLEDTEKKAKEIRSKLFSFADGSQVNFGDLYKFAKQASAGTGIRTEFILAILEQESAFGTNVGQCYISNTEGSLVTIKSGESRGKMRPDSVPHFFKITEKLGRDSYKTRVSCALSYGYGGAMGMSQFMPATWVMYENSVKNSTGATGADPWNPYHAITGTAYLLKDNGAGTQKYNDERNAACRYYSGGSCAKGAAVAKYGDQVMNRIPGIQAKIDVLK